MRHLLILLLLLQATAIVGRPQAKSTFLRDFVKELDRIAINNSSNIEQLAKLLHSKTAELSMTMLGSALLVAAEEGYGVAPLKSGHPTGS